jgi:hypothetical protein
VAKYARSVIEFGEEQELAESDASDEEMSEALDEYPEDVRMLCDEDCIDSSFKWHLANSSINKRLSDT